MERDAPPSRTAPQFVVRLPDGMRGRIAEAAKSSGRSMNAEIVARLQASFEESPTSLSKDFLLDLIRQLIKEQLKSLPAANADVPSLLSAEGNQTPAKKLRAGGKSQAIKPEGSR